MSIISGSRLHDPFFGVIDVTLKVVNTAMSAAEALRAADAAGICIGIDGDDLTLEASVAQPPAVLDQLSSSQGGRHGATAPGQRWLLGRGLAGLV